MAGTILDWLWHFQELVAPGFSPAGPVLQSPWFTVPWLWGHMSYSSSEAPSASPPGGSLGTA